MYWPTIKSEATAEFAEIESRVATEGVVPNCDHIPELEVVPIKLACVMASQDSWSEPASAASTTETSMVSRFGEHAPPDVEETVHTN